MTSSINGMGSSGGPGVDVLLVYPAYETILEKRGRFLTTIPLGIAYLVSALETGGFTVETLDLSVHRELSIVDIASRIANSSPKMLCFSLTSMGLRQAFMINSELRRRGFKCVVVAGGPHVTAYPLIILEFGADYGVVGEGEHSLVALCNQVIRGRGVAEGIVGVVRKDKGFLGTTTTPCETIRDLNQLPPPARHLFETKRYNYASIITSRGCPFECAYCATAQMTFRQRSLDNIFKEIEGVQKQLNPNSITFVDNVFTLNRTFAIDFCLRFKGSVKDMAWTCATRADLLDEELIKTMASSGCDRISIGVESGVEEIRFRIGKKVTNKQYETAFRLCRKAGIKTSAYFMLGHPGETKKDIDATVEFALKLDPDDAFFTPSIILPKTKLMEYCLSNNLVDKNAWNDFMKGVKDVPYLMPEDFKNHTVDTLQLYAMRKYFLDVGYISRKIFKSRSPSDIIEVGKLTAGVLVDRVLVRQDIIPYEE